MEEDLIKLRRLGDRVFDVAMSLDAEDAAQLGQMVNALCRIVELKRKLNPGDQEPKPANITFLPAFPKKVNV
jgi:hypothetical protein